MRQSWRWGQIPAGERGRAGRWGLVFGLLAGAAAVLAVWNVCSGSVVISPGDVILALAGEEMDETASIVRNVLHGECRHKEVCGS